MVLESWVRYFILSPITVQSVSSSIYWKWFESLLYMTCRIFLLHVEKFYTSQKLGFLSYSRFPQCEVFLLFLLTFTLSIGLIWFHGQRLRAVQLFLNLSETWLTDFWKSGPSTHFLDLCFKFNIWMLPFSGHLPTWCSYNVPYADLYTRTCCQSPVLSS